MITIQTLQKNHDRSKFDCGNKILNEYLQKYARQNQNKHLQKTYVVVDEYDLVLAYMTVASGSGSDNVERSCLNLLRLATDKHYQKSGYGGALLQEAFKIAIMLDDTIGCTGLRVDAKGASIAFYQNLGFTELDPIPNPIQENSIIPMFLPIKTIKSIPLT